MSASISANKAIGIVPGFVQGSVLLGLVARVAAVGQAAWHGSISGRWLLALWHAVAGAVDGSWSLGWLVHRGPVAAWWEASLISRLCLGLWAWVSRGGVALAGACGPALASSFFLGTVPRWHRASLLHRLLLWVGGLPVERGAAAATGSSTPGIAWLFGAFFALLPFAPTSLLIVLAWLLIIGTIWWRWQRGEGSWWPSRLNLPYLAWGLVLLGATISSVDFRGSLVSLTLYMSYLGVGWAATQVIRTRDDLAGVIGYALAGGAAAAGLAVWQRIIGATHSSEPWVDPAMADQITRVFWPFDNPNVLASYLACLLPLALGAFLSSPTWRQRLAQGAVVTVAALALLLTFSRGGWLAAGLAAIWIGVVRDRRLLVLGLVAGLAALVVAPDIIMRRLASIVSLTDTSNYYRISLWRTAQVMLQDHWQYGIGLGMQAFSRIYPDYMLAGARAAHFHNLFLQVWIELGIGGLVSLLWVVLVFVQDSFAALFRPLRQVVDRAGALAWAGFTAAAVGIIAGYLLHGMVEYNWFSPKTAFLFWLVIGLGAGAARVLRGEQPDAGAVRPEVQA